MAKIESVRYVRMKYRSFKGAGFDTWVRFNVYLMLAATFCSNKVDFLNVHQPFKKFR
jgi:hypothetical protein